MIRRSAILLGLVRAAVLMQLAAAFLSQIALAQQPAPSREALEAAERMISSQTRAGYSEASLSPMIAGAIDVHADAKALAAPIKSELTAAVAKSILARLPKPNDELVRVFASAMSLEELQAAAAFFDGPVVRRMSAATSQMKIEAGKPPEVSADFDAAMKERHCSTSRERAKRFWRP